MGTRFRELCGLPPLSPEEQRWQKQSIRHLTGFPGKEIWEGYRYAFACLGALALIVAYSTKEALEDLTLMHATMIENSSGPSEQLQGHQYKVDEGGQ